MALRKLEGLLLPAQLLSERVASDSAERALRLVKLSLPLVRLRILRKPLRELLDLVAEVTA